MPRLAFAALALLLAGCLGDAPPSFSDASVDAAQAGDLAQRNRDGGAPSPPDLAGRGIPDLAGTDLTGLFDCYGVSICDPAAQFCLKYHSGSQAAPGNVVSGPACYEPADPCGSQGQQMDCGCIQNDSTLGSGCQGSCVDNGNGTFDCYQS